MFCEITVKHRSAVDANGLTSVIKGSFSNPIELADAYARSAIYKRHAPTSSICAFELAGSCFVILRKVSVDESQYHLEGNAPTVSVRTLLEEAQTFSRQLITQLRDKATGSQFKCDKLAARLFEDNGNETGLMGEPVTIGSVFREKFAWKEIAPALITFVTAILLFWQGLDDKPVRAAVYSLGVVVFFMLANAVAQYGWAGGKITWKLSELI
jgi:hypothetical protein